MRAGVTQGELVFPVLFSLYMNDITTTSRHVELGQYADYTALVATSRSPSLLVGYLEAISVGWSCGYGIGGLPSRSRRALLRSLLKPRDASKNPEKCSFQESRYGGSKLLVSLG
jgi:hypothetical protein